MVFGTRLIQFFQQMQDAISADVKLVEVNG